MLSLLLFESMCSCSLKQRIMMLQPTVCLKTTTGWSWEQMVTEHKTIKRKWEKRTRGKKTADCDRAEVELSARLQVRMSWACCSTSMAMFLTSPHQKSRRSFIPLIWKQTGHSDWHSTNILQNMLDQLQEWFVPKTGLYFCYYMNFFIYRYRYRQ